MKKAEDVTRDIKTLTMWKNKGFTTFANKALIDIITKDRAERIKMILMLVGLAMDRARTHPDYGKETTGGAWHEGYLKACTDMVKEIHKKFGGEL